MSAARVQHVDEYTYTVISGRTGPIKAYSRSYGAVLNVVQGRAERRYLFSILS